MILEVPDVMFVRVVCVPIINFCTCALKLIYRYVLVCITLDKLFYVVCDVWAHLPRVTREPFHMLIHVIPGDARDDLRATDITRFYLSPPPTCETIHTAIRHAKYGLSLSTANFVISFAVHFHDVFNASKLLKNPSLTFR